MADFAGNFINALGAGYQAREMRDRAEERDRRKMLAPDVQAAIGGDKAALGRIAGVDPSWAMQLGPIMDRMDAAKQAEAARAAQFSYQAADSILKVAPEERAALYPQLIAHGKTLGFDLSHLPQQWTPQMEGWARTMRELSIPVLEKWKVEQKRPQEVSVDAPGTPQAAIGGIETGGQPNGGYRAVGPVANAQGDRAYGKYQVMGANIGPWTQEILGTAMTPQQFLDDPQAQEKVFAAKFGQYIKQYGLQGASRAWFAGPGGMNNPNARDVNGMSVAGYERKFTEGMGGGAAAPGVPGPVASPPPQGDATPQGNAPADGSGTPNPPQVAAPDLHSLRTYIRQTYGPGSKIVTDPITGQGLYDHAGRLFIKRPDGTPDYVIVPKLEQPATGYQNIPGGQSFITGGPADPVVVKNLAEAKRELRAIPAAENDKLSTNVTLVNRIDKAIGAYTGIAGAPPQSGRVAGWLARNAGQGGDLLAQEMDPKGVEARALIADINSQIMLARSGAAVTESEAKRLVALLPSPSDKPEVIAQKLRQVRDTYAEITRGQAAQYSEKNGYIPHAGVQSLGAAPAAPPAAAQPPAPGPAATPAPAQPADNGKRLSPEEAAKLPPGTKFIGTDGVERVRR